MVNWLPLGGGSPGTPPRLTTARGPAAVQRLQKKVGNFSRSSTFCQPRTATPTSPTQHHCPRPSKMKRKLDENDRPSVSETDKTTGSEFTDFDLDPRLLQAIKMEEYAKPTRVQLEAIPLGLAGQDVLCKAKTGSGKTAAYVLPLLQSILKKKQTSPTPSTSALVLVPTRELADQTFKVIERLAAFCAKDIQSVKLTDKVSDTVQRSLLSNSPDIVISTPARAWNNVNSSALSLENLTCLILDEADLILSYGYSEDMDNLSKSIPKGVQTIMMSATLSAEVDALKKFFYREPTLLDLEEPEEDGEGITHYVVKYVTP